MSNVRSRTVADAQLPNLQSLIREQLCYFESDAQRSAFLASAVAPFAVKQLWAYGSEEHTCFVVARSASEQVVYCASGFGPAFPWSIQHIGATDLGTDEQWCAYLYECFVSSSLWPHPLPSGFKLMGPNERSET